MKPYYEDSACVIYHGDCREILPAISAGVSLLLSDPPYGMSIGSRSGGDRSRLAVEGARGVVGDDVEFDPSHLLKFSRVVLFGANHFAHRLPPSSGWFVWDKRAGGTPDDSADCELAWTNVARPARLYSHLWRGMIKASERDQRRVHPTQKPVALMAWIISQMTQAGDLVLDPYMGSGPVLRAAKDMQRRAIGVEIVEQYCEIAAQRLSQQVLELGA